MNFLRIAVGQSNTVSGYPVDVGYGCHHALVVPADVEPANVVGQMIRTFSLLSGISRSFARSGVHP
jgi:hypothetical protein